MREIDRVSTSSPGFFSKAPRKSINGGMAYDNNILINGVNMQDNIFGNTNNLFIEDAVQEVSVLTGGIPSSYGRFSGGVVNVITKSGGNTFSGSFRTSLSNGYTVTNQIAFAPSLASALDRLARVRTAAGGTGKLTISRAFDPTAGNYGA